MIPLTQRDRLTHKASWHDPATAEGRKINTEHAALLAKDYQATKDRLIADAIRCKLGNLPPPDILQDRLEFRCQKGEMIDGRQLFWLVLDGEAIAIMTEPETKQVGHFFLLTWLFKSLVTQWERN